MHNTFHINFHSNLKHHTSNRRLDLGASVAEEVDREILDTRMAAQEVQEDGASSQEEADVADHSDLEVQVSREPQAAREAQADQEEAEVDQAAAEPTGHLLPAG